jgi:ankyrin repeat protein
VSGRGAGGTPLVVALFWGHRAVVEPLLAAGRHPDNLRVAAGIGDVERIRALVPSRGAPSEAAGALRGFYRPHGGFPSWKPTENSQEILDEALSWAARSGRADAISVLVELGANPAADVYRGTALTWAAAINRVEAIERLLSLGADPNQQATFGGPDHGVEVTALHIAASSGSIAAVDTLLTAGANPSLHDSLHNGTAAGWAFHGGHPTLAERLSALEDA